VVTSSQELTTGSSYTTAVDTNPGLALRSWPQILLRMLAGRECALACMVVRFIPSSSECVAEAAPSLVDGRIRRLTLGYQSKTRKLSLKMVVCRQASHDGPLNRCGIEGSPI
jgi:hypothetical protein